MGLEIIEGVIAATGEASPLASASGETGEMRSTGLSWAFVQFKRVRGKPVMAQDVIADTAMAAQIAVGVAGRFAFYTHRNAHRQAMVLCGFSDGERVDVAAGADDPVALETEVQRTRGKRKILLGALMIPTLLLITFGIDAIRNGRAVLKDHPRPRRPEEAKIRKALERR